MHKTLMYHLIDFCKINNYVTTIQVNKQNSASIPETLVRSISPFSMQPFTQSPDFSKEHHLRLPFKFIHCHPIGVLGESRNKSVFRLTYLIGNPDTFLWK